MSDVAPEVEKLARELCREDGKDPDYGLWISSRSFWVYRWHDYVERARESLASEVAP